MHLHTLRFDKMFLKTQYLKYKAKDLQVNNLKIINLSSFMVRLTKRRWSLWFGQSLLFVVSLAENFCSQVWWKLMGKGIGYTIFMVESLPVRNSFISLFSALLNPSNQPSFLLKEYTTDFTNCITVVNLIIYSFIKTFLHHSVLYFTIFFAPNNSSLHS